MKKSLETLIDMMMEQADDIQEIKKRMVELTNPNTKKKGLDGLCEILGCCKTTAAKWLKSGIIPYSRLGDIYMFDETEVLDAVKKHKSKRPR